MGNYKLPAHTQGKRRALLRTRGAGDFCRGDLDRHSAGLGRCSEHGRDGLPDFSVCPPLSLVVEMDAEISVLRDHRRDWRRSGAGIQTSTGTDGAEGGGMRRASLFAAAAVVLIGNAFGLIHAWRNRTAPADSEVTLTEREAPMALQADEEDSGVALDFRWINPYSGLFAWGGAPPWMDEKTFREFGFDTTVAPDDPKAVEFYQ